MGAYAPAPVATPQILSRIHDDILRPTIDGMRRDGLPLSSLSLLSIDALSGHPFVGLLFTGLILTPSGPKVLEYNVRFGDPETEALLLLLDDNTDFAAILHASLHHLSLSPCPFLTLSRPALNTISIPFPSTSNQATPSPSSSPLKGTPALIQSANKSPFLPLPLPVRILPHPP